MSVLFKHEPAQVIGAVVSLIVLVLNVLDNSLELADALQASIPYLTTLVVRSYVTPSALIEWSDSEEGDA